VGIISWVGANVHGHQHPSEAMQKKENSLLSKIAADVPRHLVCTHADRDEIGAV
jgi:hypothetical protein